MSRARRGVGRGQQRKASDARADRAAFLLWAALAALAAARIALSFTSGMWMWGLNLQRFLDPVIGWPTWLAATLTLIPALARRLEPGAASLGDALSRRRVLASAALTLLVAGFAWGSADNTRFVGDFLLRQGTVELNGRPAQLFPQALPLDVFLHYTLPSALQGAHLMSANESARLLGAIDAAALALVAMAFVRSLALTGAGGFAAWAVVVFGGYLGMFTGYGKSLAELVTLAAAIGAFGLRVARDGRGKVALGMTLALALALHRSAVVFLLPAAVAWGVALRREGVATLRTRQTWIALGVPLATLALLGARIVTTMMKFDTIHLAPYQVRHQGVLAAAFAGTRVLDFVNLLLMLSPLALAAPILAARLGRVREWGRETAVLLALALPMLAAVPFIHPAQGLFRDWDDFAATGCALSLVVAWLIGETLRGASNRRWIAVPVVASVMMSALQGLAHSTDVDQGMRRVRAFALEAPPRTDIERAGVWDFLGIRNYRLDRYHAAADAYAHAADYAPSPRLLQQWALAETMAGNLERAQEVYHRLLMKDPNNTSGWLGLGAVASRIPDPDDSFRAARKVLELEPNHVGGHQLLDYLRKTYPGRDTVGAGR